MLYEIVRVVAPDYPGVAPRGRNALEQHVDLKLAKSRCDLYNGDRRTKDERLKYVVEWVEISGPRRKVVYGEGAAVNA